MGKFSSTKRKGIDTLQFKYNRNTYIRAEMLQVIDDEGNNLGEMSRDEALAIAQERELDLIELSPNAKPPVAKIMSWSKFKYDQSKKKKESKSKNIEQKEMWFKVFIEKGDLDHKLKRVKEFLAKKHPVKLTIRSKGRVSRENMLGLMDRIIEGLKEDAMYDSPPKYEGRNFAVIVKPVKKI